MTTPPQPLPPREVAGALAARGLGAWSHADDALVRDYRFASFAEALAWMAGLAPVCDALDHHPTWSNTYDRVQVRLTTHAAGDRVTARDLELASAMEERFGRLGA